jgi:hypothetical protein
VETYVEVEREFPDYGRAAKAACAWYTTGTENGTPETWNNQFVLYKA